MDDELITERRRVAFPQVFGYLRHVTGGLVRHAALVDCLTDYCRRHELALCGVFTDRDATVAIRSPAFVGLVDTLELPDTYGAVGGTKYPSASSGADGRAACAAIIAPSCAPISM